ncbi:MAG: hypothetical protein JST30_11110 [Armatimonadetes bacterium]|nr:hypothetical protein [Armatimonadota bacterium]
MRQFRTALVLFALVLPFAASAQGAAAKPNADQAKLTKLEKAYTTTKAAFKKKPKDATAKKTYVKATVDYGTAVMTAGSLAPRVKYPKALALYREALKTDPNNKEAKQSAKMIEDIYKSMGRPVPKTL